MSRTRNVKLNIGSAMAYQFVNLLNNFLNRTFFVYVLGLNYLSLNGLFSDVLLALSLADLGFSAAIGYSLYRPLAENDTLKIQAYMNLYKKAYRLIGIVIAILGISLIPFLPYVVNFDKDVEVNYIAIYLMFLANTVLSYLFLAYKGTIITAAQYEYKLVKVNLLCSSILHVSQILGLIISKNYYVYLAVPIVMNLVKNVLVSKKAEQLFPCIKKCNHARLDKKERKEVFKNVCALSLTKLSMIIYQVSDNIVISICINTMLVGIYSNYLMITKALNNIFLLIFSAFRSGIGNMNAVDTSQKKRMVFRRIVFFNFWSYGFCSIALYEMLNPLIRIWFGESYLFRKNIVLLISLIFLVPGFNQTVTIYKDACGLFWQTRYRTLITAIVNVVVSVVLSKIIGVSGVFIATILAYLVTIYPIDPRILYREVFHASSKEYYLMLCKGFVITIVTGAVVEAIVRQITIDNQYLSFVMTGIIVVMVTNVLFFLFYRKTEEFQYYKGMVRGMFHRADNIQAN